MNLRYYSERVLRPMLLDNISSGAFDNILSEEYLLIYKNDPEMFTAIIERMKILAIKENDR